VTHAQSILDRRRAGVLLHITSLPGGLGNGDLGAEAYRFVDVLGQCGMSVWQTLPVNPTHPDGSPYQCLSAHAGNPLLIDLGWLAERGWLDRDAATLAAHANPAQHRRACLDRAFDAYTQLESDEAKTDYREFIEAHASWLNDYALFMALREEQGGRAWQDWPENLRDRDPAALEAAQKRLSRALEQVCFEQFIFFRQWQSLRDYANRRGILLFGDIPIFVAGDSADVWSRRDEFDLNAEGRPRVVAGVPPDYFSATGQRWGNPHYRWNLMEANGFKWWLERFRSQLALYDWVRVDHFRGFEAYWEIPAESDTAMQGHWVPAPGQALLETLVGTLGNGRLPLIAENLGIITPEVEALRERFNIPGMLILQFAFDGGPGNPYLPHNHNPNDVVYTGTHDNDTTVSWFEDLSQDQQSHIKDYLGNPDSSMPDALIRCAMASVAKLAIIPLQDILSLGKGHRMNTPGTVVDNWQWRFEWDQITDSRCADIAGWVELYGRKV
jgi:4-alpha-glucanotransferase